MAAPKPHFASTDEHSLAPATRTLAIDPETGGVNGPEEGATVYVGTGGNIVIRGMRDSDETKTPFKNVPSGSFLPVRVRTVYGSDDGTTASDLVVIW